MTRKKDRMCVPKKATTWKTTEAVEQTPRPWMLLRVHDKQRCRYEPVAGLLRLALFLTFPCVHIED